MTGEPVIVDNGDVLPNRGVAELTTTILQDGVALNLTGKTVVATIRRESQMDTVVNALLEDHDVVVTTPASGITTLTMVDATLQTIDVPDDNTKAYPYLIAYKVVEDPYYPQFLRVYFYGVLD